MANTYVAIATTTVGSGGAANITFSSIPQTYTDLKVVYSVRFSSGGANQTMIVWQFNNSSSAQYSATVLYGTGSAVGSGSNSGYTELYYSYGSGSASTANTFGNGEIYIPNYTSSNYKSVSTDGVTENNATAAFAALNAGLWSNTSAISSIKALNSGGETFAQYSTFTLYGIKNS